MPKYKLPKTCSNTPAPSANRLSKTINPHIAKVIRPAQSSILPTISNIPTSSPKYAATAHKALPPSTPIFPHSLRNFNAVAKSIIEVQNILNRYEEVSALLHSDEHHSLNAEWIKRLHAIALARLELDQDITPGEVRNIEVGVGRYLCPPAAECERMVERLCEWLDEIDEAQPNAPKLALPILKAILAHLYLVWIHPFADGNGRTARLLEHHIMLAGGVPETATHLLSDFYNETRSEYYRRLEASSKAISGAIGFLLYALQGFVDELSEQIEYTLQRVCRDMWASYIVAQFRTNIDPTSQRRIILARNLPTKPIHRKRLLTLNQEIALTYSNKSAQTLTRDLNALKQMGLVERTSEGVRAKTETLRLHNPYHLDAL